MDIIQILVIIFALFAISRSLLRLRDKNITRSEFFFWISVWIVVIFIASLPKVTDVITQPLGISRGIDVAVYVSIILLFYLIFRLYVKTEQVNKDLTRMVRELAQEHSSLDNVKKITKQPKTEEKAAKINPKNFTHS